MLKKVLLTEKEVTVLKDMLSSEKEVIEKTIVEDEREGEDLAICREEIAGLESIYKKLLK